MTSTTDDAPAEAAEISPTPEAPEAADEAAAEDGGEAVGRGGGAPARRRVLVIAVALAALAAAAFGVLWALAVTSGSLELARDRDAVLVDARQAAINLNTLDYRN